MSDEIDFLFRNHGSLFLAIPQTNAADKHLRANVSDEAQWWAGGVAVEPRYVEDLASALQEAGFEVSFE